MSEQAKWYVIHTYSGYENKVAQNIEKVVENRKLQELIPEVRIPMEHITEIKENKTTEAERKLFPSYVLVKMVMNDDSWYIVRNTRGVTGFVGPASKPIPLTDKEVAVLGIEDEIKKTVKVTFKVGDNVLVTGGSFEGFTGVVQAIDLEAQTADVVVSMFGRETSVNLPINQIKVEE
ncbi:MAG: transcription termination/antitermination protein NusG [Ruminococcus sp.]|nr:transcription termination/antitermination protein NusG [Ruminococcus sp.]